MRFRGLRFEILGNLAVVSLISLALTGFGVWFINGNHLLQQHLYQGRMLVESFAEEALGLLPPEAFAGIADDRELRVAVEDLMRRYVERDPRIRLHLVDPELRVLSSTGGGISNLPSGEEALRICFRTGEPYARLDGKPLLFGSFHQATFAFPLRRSGRLLAGVVATLPMDGVVRSARQTVRFILIYICLGSLVFLIFGTVLISRTVVHPLETTIAVMRRVADGDLQQKVEPEGDNEVGLLARTFNTMAEKLKGHEKTLNEHLKSLQKMNQDLKATQQEVIQSEKLASVGLLAAGIAHEIGNPLGAVLGYIAMLEQGVAEPQEQKDYLKRMEKEVLRIDGIVRDLREYSRPSPPKPMPTDLNGFIRDTVSMMKRRHDFRGVRFELRLEEPLSPVSVDPGQVQQVLVNLFLNAKDAMEGEGSVRVASRMCRYASPETKRVGGPARREGDPPGIDYRLLRRTHPARKWPFLEGQAVVEIEVSDTGPGISRENLPRVFDPFFTTKEAGRGTGLGLSVSQRIIESFCGDIRITSGANESARVSIRLPVLEDDPSGIRTPGEEMLKDGTTGSHRG
jgi:hypothetical protein